jgi:two-component sensor histidine kinase
VSDPDKNNRINWQDFSQRSAIAYAFAIILVAIAGFLRWGLEFFTSDLQAFTTFYPAVLFAALFGGAGPGLIAALLGGIICWWTFLPPYTSLLPLSRADEINLATYFVASALIVWATDHYRRLTKRLKDEEGFRKLAVDELAHRLKNKVATIQAIVSFRLRDYPQVRDEIFSSLTALMDTDDLITAAQGAGANIRDILSAETAPYEVSRISMNGPDCLLSPKLAVTMALLVHELATNAAKYGALSNTTGTLSIKWSVARARLSLTWRESGGPQVSPPNHSGFGTRLFRRALGQFDGKVEATFAPTGLVCALSVLLPEHSPHRADDLTSKGSELPVVEKPV